MRPREPVGVVPTASAKSTPVKSPEKKKSKGDGIESRKEPIVKDLSGKFDSVAGGAPSVPIDLEDSPMTSSAVRNLVTSESHCITGSHIDLHLGIYAGI